MPSDGKEHFPRPKWNQAVIWTGSDLLGLLQILNKNRWHVRPLCWPGCLADLAFATGNTSLRAVESLVYRESVKLAEITPDPVFILGHWRTGTTLLHDLLSLDARHTAPSTYQCFLPNHFLLTERLLKRWSSFTLPGNRPPDKMKMGWDRPQEDEFALCNMGVPSVYSTIAFPNHPPQNLEYLELESISKQRRSRWKAAWLSFLQRVQYRSPGRLVLKSPTHTFRLPVLLEMFPSARFVHLTRHPVAVFMSTVRLWKSLFFSHAYQKPRFEDLEEFVFTTFLHMHQRLETTRHLVPRGRFVDVRYEDFVDGITSTMRRIYERLELGGFEQIEPDIESYVAEHSQYQPNQHEPAPDLEDEIYQRWRPYFEKYGYQAKMPASVTS